MSTRWVIASVLRRLPFPSQIISLLPNLGYGDMRVQTHVWHFPGRSFVRLINFGLKKNKKNIAPRSKNSSGLGLLLMVLATGRSLHLLSWSMFVFLY